MLRDLGLEQDYDKIRKILQLFLSETVDENTLLREKMRQK